MMHIRMFLASQDVAKAANILLNKTAVLIESGLKEIRATERNQVIWNIPCHSRLHWGYTIAEL